MCFRGLHWWDSGRLSGSHSSKTATQPRCGQSTLEALERGARNAESSGRRRATRARANTRREKRRAGVPQGRAESDTMFSWYDMMKVNWNILCRTAGRRDIASPMIFFKHEEVCFSVCLRACAIARAKPHNVSRSCHRYCCHVAVNRLSDLKSQSNCRTRTDLCRVRLRACADVLRPKHAKPLLHSFHPLKMYSR